MSTCFSKRISFTQRTGGMVNSSDRNGSGKKSGGSSSHKTGAKSHHSNGSGSTSARTTAAKALIELEKGHTSDTSPIIHQGQHQCNICNGWYSSKRFVKLHKDAVHRKIRQPCPVPGCTKDYALPSGLKRHMDKAHPGSGRAKS